MILSELAAAVAATSYDFCMLPPHTAVSGLVYDSRKAKAGDAFFCLPGSRFDGHDHAASAYEAGARIFVASRKIELPPDAAVIYTEDTRRSLADASCLFFGDPASSLLLIGITGTKGKTTTACMISDSLTAAGIPTGYIGTNGVRMGDYSEGSANTTPESHELHRIFRKIKDMGGRAVVLEVSSQAVVAGRIRGISFDVGVFTNFSPDHIGPSEHPDLDSYFAAKTEFFSKYCATSVIANADDPVAEAMVSGSSARVSYSSVTSENASGWCGLNMRARPTGFGSSFEVSHDGRIEGSLSILMPGDFNASNALQAYAAAREASRLLFGETEAEAIIPQLLRGIENARTDGRFEVIERAGRRFIIDYAHNGKSLTAALRLLRSYSPERLICLFGSVGGRTYMRRAELAAAASREADMCIITSDNPDHEEPSKIIGEIYAHFSGSGCPAVCIEDRAAAIEYAVSSSKPGDIVLLAGKGHEKYQLVRGMRLPFCERELVEKYADRYLGEPAGV